MVRRVNMGQAAVVLVLGALAFAPCAWAETTSRLAEKLARFERYAGPPVERIRNYRLYRWQPLGREELAIWANPKDVYLVRVHGPCSGLDFARTIGTTTNGGVRSLSTRFDAVVFDEQRCLIRSIEPVDYVALREEERRARK